MKGANGKSVLVGAIIGILSVGVAFAGFTSTLTINGTAQVSGDFNVKFTAASAADTKATTTVPTIAADTGVMSFDISTELQEPGSQSVVSYTVSNLGSIGANLTAPSVTCYSDSGKATTIECSDVDISINAGAINPTALNKTETATGSITIKWNDESEQVPENTTRFFTVTINASQAS